MGTELTTVRGDEPSEAFVLHAIETHERERVPALRRLWSYYRNDDDGGTLAQEEGLPDRLTGAPSRHRDDRAGRREIVVENDIAWRIHTMVDFMFGKPVQILSTADDEDDRRAIERLLDSIWERSGGIALLQDTALLGHVYGYVDLVLRVDERGLAARTGRAFGEESAHDLAECFRIELVEPTRGVPVLDPADYREIAAYALRYSVELNEIEHKPARGIFARRGPRTTSTQRRRVERTEVLTPFGRTLLQDGEPVERDPIGWTGGEMPVVHIQNLALPFRYEGLSEVEALIPLQDELNTRLSDRANRVTLQSFKMYLARGLDGFDQVPVGPGVVWSTDNPDASISEFGGDAQSPSEQSHIDEIREALDKVSAVPPLAGGVVRAKIGNLSSANALKITLMSLLGKTGRKRVTYGRGIERVCELVLTALDATGVKEIARTDRGVRIEWPDPLPTDIRDEALAAKTKVELGVPAERVLGELGYAPTDPGIT